MNDKKSVFDENIENVKKPLLHFREKFVFGLFF